MTCFRCFQADDTKLNARSSLILALRYFGSLTSSNPGTVRSLYSVNFLNQRTDKESCNCLWASHPSLKTSDSRASTTTNSQAPLGPPQFVPSFFSLFLAKTQPEVEKGREKFTEQLRKVNEALKESSPEGPFFSGESLGAVDVNLIPFAVRLFLLERLRGYKSEAPPQLVVPKKEGRLNHVRLPRIHQCDGVSPQQHSIGPFDLKAGKALKSVVARSHLIRRQLMSKR